MRLRHCGDFLGFEQPASRPRFGCKIEAAPVSSTRANSYFVSRSPVSIGIRPGKLVQLAPHAITDIDWGGRSVGVNVTREQVRSAPAWDPLAMADDIAEQRLHRHFGWPGFGS